MDIYDQVNRDILIVKLLGACNADELYLSTEELMLLTNIQMGLHKISDQRPNKPFEELLINAQDIMREYVSIISSDEEPEEDCNCLCSAD